MARPNPNEHAAKLLDYSCQPKPLLELIADRPGAPKRRLLRNKTLLETSLTFPGLRKLATHRYYWWDQILSTYPMKKPTAKLLKAIVQHHDSEKTDTVIFLTILQK